ncbi:MAG TPA: ATP-binding cassette domain-containing protein [Ramlibacter sp.]|jgi:putative ABC transport system ATP-binding protein|uniref:ABC transporter ATP-binding protein n=1 Tax=Ramlibacter sp. TaxID=1917967 RepID=UPI002D2A5E6C|nr:ATP-binding cassette domain-containing protein [Ramlibacter sp.]HZY20202.1 ATP-binding cassette domain-containing protein [Ramlibacter sp.]
MIRTRSLAYAYPGGAPLRFDDLDVAQGAALLLLGPSGAGKSTWLALAAGLLTATGGTIEVAGQDLAALRGPARDAWRGRAIGFLPQKLHLSEALDVEDNLALSFFAAGLPRNAGAIAAVLSSLGVGELARRRPSQLSGGQAQRVALARSVLLAPRVILADEPTASLDDDACAASVALLRDAAGRCGATLVIATHDRRVREALADAVVHRLQARVAA